MIKSLIVILFVFGGKSLAKPRTNQNCPTQMQSADWARIPPSLGTSFEYMVAHGIHSLTIQDINYYFPNNKNDNDIVIPVANPDLNSSEPILSRPTNFEYGFKNPAFRAIELVLSNMNNPDHGIRFNTDLEKIIHAAHMQDIWIEGALAYSKLQKSEAIEDKSICSCITDVENNGVLDELKKIVQRLRNGESNGDGYNDSYHESYCNGTICKRHMDLIKDVETWIIWKNVHVEFNKNVDKYGQILALYMHCKLNA